MMNTDKTIKQIFIKGNKKSWKTHKIFEVDVNYVILNLLKESFVVEIDNFKYDISFGLNQCTQEIGQVVYMEDSPSLTSFEILNKGFAYGKWYILLNEKLSVSEKRIIENELENIRKIQADKFVKDLIKTVIEGENNKYEEFRK